MGSCPLIGAVGSTRKSAQSPCQAGLWDYDAVHARAAMRQARREDVFMTTAALLGYADTERLLIVNADDAGMCHSVNQAIIASLERGLITSASVMVPPNWFPEIARYAREHPDRDFGVHLTFTSEWEDYRWGPLCGAAAVPSWAQTLSAPPPTLLPPQGSAPADPAGARHSPLAAQRVQTADVITRAKLREICAKQTWICRWVLVAAPVGPPGVGFSWVIIDVDSAPQPFSHSMRKVLISKGLTSNRKRWAEHCGSVSSSSIRLVSAKAVVPGTLTSTAPRWLSAS